MVWSLKENEAVHVLNSSIASVSLFVNYLPHWQVAELGPQFHQYKFRVTPLIIVSI